MPFYVLFVKDLFILQTESELKQGERQEKGEGVADFLMSREPDVGLKPRMPGS